jgi:hypothetical protein
MLLGESISIPRIDLEELCEATVSLVQVSAAAVVLKPTVTDNYHLSPHGLGTHQLYHLRLCLDLKCV